MNYRKTLAALANLITQWDEAQQRIDDNKNTERIKLNELKLQIRNHGKTIQKILIDEQTKCDATGECENQSQPNN